MAKVAIKPVHPIIPYFGGKSRVAKAIIKLIPKHKCYAEPFAGGLSVLLTKEPSKREVVNDYDTELLHLYKMVKYRLPDLLEGIKGVPSSRRLFKDWLSQDPTYLNDIFRAVRKLYIIRNSFGGRAWHYGADKTRPRFNPNNLKVWLEKFAKRTSLVTLECLDVLDFLRIYDGKDTFFYIDPVYLGKDDYAQKFGKNAQHQRLRNALAELQGKWLLSHHDCKEVRELYNGFKISPLRVLYSVNKLQKGKVVTELLIRNY